MFRIILKQLREENKISQQQLANKLKVSQSTVAMWENGKNKPEFDTLIEIADYFKVSIDYLLGKSDDKKMSEDENISERDKKLINLLLGLNEDEVQRVRDFVDGLKANRITDSSSKK